MRIIGLLAGLGAGLLLAAGAGANPPLKVDLDIGGRRCPEEKAIDRCPIPRPTPFQHPQYADIVPKGQEAEVTYGYCMTSRGQIRNIELVTSSGIPELDRRVLAAVAKWKFDPPIINGKPATVCGLRMGYFIEGETRS